MRSKNDRPLLKLCKKIPAQGPLYNPGYKPNMYACSRLYGGSFQLYYTETQRIMDKLSEGVFKSGKTEVQKKPEKAKPVRERVVLLDGFSGAKSTYVKGAKGWVDGQFVG